MGSMGCLNAIEWFELFDGIAFDTGTNSLLDDGVEIDEQLGPEHSRSISFSRVA